MALFCGIHEKYAMWKFIVDVVHDFVSSLQPDVGRGFLHVSNVFLLTLLSYRFPFDIPVSEFVYGNYHCYVYCCAQILWHHLPHIGYDVEHMLTQSCDQYTRLQIHRIFQIIITRHNQKCYIVENCFNMTRFPL